MSQREMVVTKKTVACLAAAAFGVGATAVGLAVLLGGGLWYITIGIDAGALSAVALGSIRRRRLRRESSVAVAAGLESSRSSARSSAADLGAGTWQARPVLARLVKAAVICVPLGAAVGLNRLVVPLLPRPGGWGATTLWFGLLVLCSVVGYKLSHRLMVRLVPLATLLSMTLVFPDKAPPRFRTALRGSSAKDLARKLRDPTAKPDDLPGPAEAAAELVVLVAQLSAHDRMTRGHSERVRAYSDVIGQQLGLSDEDRQKLTWAALLHDVGKLFVPVEILNKPGRPNDQEWELIRRHPAEAAAILRPLEDWLGDWLLAAGEHHERFDGGGYPNGFAGSEISLAGRIVAVADAYDVMTSARSYKKPLPVEAAREELVRNAGSQFDPVVVRAMLGTSLDKGQAQLGGLGAIAELPSLISNVGVTAGTTAVTVAATATVALGSVLAASVSASTATDPVPAVVVAQSTDVDSPPLGELRVAATPPPAIAVITAPSPVLVAQPSSAATAATTTTSTTITTTTTGPPQTTTPPGTTAAPTTTQVPSSTTTSPLTPTATTSAPATTSVPVTTTAQLPSTTTTTTSPTTTTPTTTTTTTPPTTTTQPPSTTTTTSPPSDWAKNDITTATSGSPKWVFVLFNDTFPEWPNLGSVTVISSPSNGTATVGGLGVITYTSTPGFTGSDVFAYSACDNNSNCDTATVFVTVEP